MRVQQFRWFAVLKSQDWRSGTIQDRQGAAVWLIRGVGIPKKCFGMLQALRTVFFQRSNSLSRNAPV
eukprot:3552226-Pyramimonas_sp.AAC.1